MDLLFLTNRFGALKENDEATAAMQLLTRLADEADAAAKVAPIGAPASTVPADSVDSGLAVTDFDALMEEVMTEATAEVTLQHQEAIKKDPKAVFDFAKEFKATMSKVSAKSAASRKLKINK